MVALQKELFPETTIRIGSLKVECKTGGWKYIYGTEKGARFCPVRDTLDLHVWLENKDGLIIDIEWLKQYKDELINMSECLDVKMKLPEYVEHQREGVTVYPFKGQRILEMHPKDWTKNKSFRYSYHRGQQYRWTKILDRMYSMKQFENLL